MLRIPSLALIGMACLSAAAFAGTPVYEVRDGVAVMEVESAPANGDWEPEHEMEGYTGKGYYT